MMRLTLLERSIVVAALAIIGVMHAASVEGCSCRRDSTPAQALVDANEVFLGYPLIMHLHEEPSVVLGVSSAHVYVQFRVTKKWKGTGERVLWVRTNSGMETCGFSFSLGGAYLVYAHHWFGGLETDSCSRTKRELDATDDLEQLGPPETRSRPRTDDAEEASVNCPS